MMLLSLVTNTAALICGAIALRTMIRSRDVDGLTAWASSLGVLGLSTAALSGSMRPFDLAAVAGVVLVGGVAGAGWFPRGRGVLLALGVLGFAAAFAMRFFAFSQSLGSPEVIDQLAWAVTRSSGFAAFLAATGAVLLGARRPSALPIGGLPARVYALHRALGITSVLALAVHLTSLWLDSYVQFSWTQLLLLPWTSSYRPVAVTLGFLTMISLLLTAANGGLRRLSPGGAWRLVHVLAYLTFALGLLHGVLAGSDSGSIGAIAFYCAAFLAVGWTLIRRLSSSGSAPRWSFSRSFSETASSFPDTTTKKRTGQTLR
jgi:sulfoxide reductase heme-binding subunit YedZ